MTRIIEIVDEVGNIDKCEVEGTRVLRVIERVKFMPSTVDNRFYEIQYAHACGYKD